MATRQRHCDEVAVGISLTTLTTVKRRAARKREVVAGYHGCEFAYTVVLETMECLVTFLKPLVKVQSEATLCSVLGFCLPA